MARGQQMESGVEGGRKVEVGRRMDQVDDTRKDEGDEMEEGMEEINYIKTRRKEGICEEKEWVLIIKDNYLLACIHCSLTAAIP